MRKMFKNLRLGVFKAVKMQNDITFELAVIENGEKAKIPTTFGSKMQDLESREKYQSLGSNHASYTNLSTVGFITS